MTNKRQKTPQLATDDELPVNPPRYNLADEVDDDEWTDWLPEET